MDCEGHLPGPTIGDNVSIYVGAIVIGGISIGVGATVGAGAAAANNVPSGTTVVGLPARPIPFPVGWKASPRRDDCWHVHGACSAAGLQSTDVPLTCSVPRGLSRHGEASVVSPDDRYVSRHL